jgi:hypothetical protein
VGKTIRQISFFLVILLAAGCYRAPEFSEVPRISFAKLQLTDTASLVLEFNVRDGDGDIGLQSESDDPDDSAVPYHPLSWIFDSQDRLVTINSEGHVGPFYAQPVARFDAFADILKFDPEDTIQYGVTVTDFRAYFRVGESVFFSEDNPKEDNVYECENFEIVEQFEIERDTIPIEIDGETFEFYDDELISFLDTVYVTRNPFHFNIYIDLLIKQGDDYVPFEFDECDPGYTARFPIFKKGTIGRPLDGSIEYAFFSTQFDPETSFLLNQTLRLRFYIYDRALNQSNVVTTPDFEILDLRRAPLVGQEN